MKIIDSHVHTYFPPKHSLHKTSVFERPEMRSFCNQLKENNVVKAISITSDDKMESATPMFLEENLSQKKDAPELFFVGGINPLKAGKNELKKTEKALSEKKIIGLKLYPGYTYFYPTDKIYHPFYKLAEKYGVPVIAHCGDVFQCPDLMFRPKIKYSHPFNIDEVAVDFPGTKFVIAHLGYPWIRGTAEIVYKNENVYADLSALFIAGAETRLKQIKHDVEFVLDYTGKTGNFCMVLIGR